MCLAVEEHDIYVLLSAPASVALVSGLVRSPSHGFALKRPSERTVAVATLSEVSDFSCLGVDHSHILIVPSSVRLVVAEDVAAVRTPCEALVTVLI